MNIGVDHDISAFAIASSIRGWLDHSLRKPRVAGAKFDQAGVEVGVADAVAIGAWSASLH